LYKAGGAVSLTNTSSLESILSELIWSRRDVLIELAAKSFRPINNIFQTNQRQATEYWIDGFIALLLEALQSNETTYRKFYIERLILDMALIELHPELILQISVAWSILLSNEIVQITPSSYRSEAVRWFSIFFAGYIGAIYNTIQGQSIYYSKILSHNLVK
jgi:hypothetical protein